MLNRTEANFGEQAVSAGDTSTIPIVIYNVGDADLHISGRQLTGTDASSFRIVLDTGRSTLVPGGQRTISIVFNPPTTGNKVAALNVSTDDPDTPVATVILRGTGI